MACTICKSFTFDAAHQLPNHDGKCRNLHGHTYRVEIILVGEISTVEDAPDEGMVMDFGRLKEVWKPLDALMDHAFLNDALPVEYHPTTAENIATFILDSLRAHLPDVTAVRVYETGSSWAQANA